MDANGRPDDYAELFERYFGMVRRVCDRATAKYGGCPEDAEDLTQQVMLRFIEWEGLDRYEPRRLHKTRDGFKVARFPTFLRAFAARFTWDMRDKTERLARESLADFDAPFWEEFATYRFDEDVETAVYVQDQLTAAWVLLGTVWLSATVTEADVFEVMVEQAKDEGKASAVPIAERFSISRSTATKWRRQVLDHLQDLGLPAILGETY